LEFWTGRNFLGQVIDFADPKYWVEKITAMSLWDIWEAFENEGWGRAAQITIPTIYGEGVQTYTGDWEENFKKLGLRKYSDLNEPKYDTQDFWADHASDFKGVAPESLTEKKGYPPYIKAIAEARLIIDDLSEKPNVKLASINADPEKGDVFADYYKQWKDRVKIVDSEDEEALKEFDKKYPKAELGNITQQQFSLLDEYWGIADKDKQTEFLENHPDLDVNLRDKYLKSHPKENAQLALWGQAKILSKEAYTEFKQLIKKYDIPNAAVPGMNLPSEESMENYFVKLPELSDEFGSNSWEVKLLLAEDDDLRKFLGRDPIDTPVEALELKIKNRAEYDTYEALETDEEREKFRQEHTDWMEDKERIEAIENTGLEFQEKWVERWQLTSEFGANSSEAKAWLLDNLEVYQWAIDNELLTDNLDELRQNEPALRINVQFREQDEQYDALLSDAEREAFLQKNPTYYEARYRRQAYEKDVPENFHIEYVEWYTNPDLKKPGNWEQRTKQDRWYEDDWYLMEHPEFHKMLVDTNQFKQLKDFSKVPKEEVFNLWLKYNQIPVDNRDERIRFRVKNPALDEWGKLVGIWTDKVQLSKREETTKKKEKVRISKRESISETQRDFERRLKELQESLGK